MTAEELMEKIGVSKEDLDRVAVFAVFSATKEQRREMLEEIYKDNEAGDKRYIYRVEQLLSRTFGSLDYLKESLSPEQYDKTIRIIGGFITNPKTALYGISFLEDVFIPMIQTNKTLMSIIPTMKKEEEK